MDMLRKPDLKDTDKAEDKKETGGQNLQEEISDLKAKLLINESED